MSVMLEYSEIDSPIHKLTGATKLIALMLWVAASMITYDTRVLVFMFAFSIIIFAVSKVEFKQISFKIGVSYRIFQMCNVIIMIFHLHNKLEE